MKIIPPDFFRTKMAKLEGRVDDDTISGQFNILTKGEVLLQPIYSGKWPRGYRGEYELRSKKSKGPYYLYGKGNFGPFIDWNMPSVLILKDSGEVWFVAEESDTTDYTIGELQGELIKSK